MKCSISTAAASREFAPFKWMWMYRHHTTFRCESVWVSFKKSQILLQLRTLFKASLLKE